MKMRLSGLLLGILLATTSVFAGGSCGAGKCGAEMKKEMKGSCGAGKCGAEMKKEMKETCTPEKMKEMKGSCGAGKCGAEMKKDSTNNEMKDKTTNK